MRGIARASGTDATSGRRLLPPCVGGVTLAVLTLALASLAAVTLAAVAARWGAMLGAAVGRGGRRFRISRLRAAVAAS